MQITVQLFAVEGSMDQTNGIKSFNCFMKTTDDQKTRGLKTKRSIVHASICYRISAQGFRSTFSIPVINYIVLSSACMFWSWDAVLREVTGRRPLYFQFCSHLRASTLLEQGGWTRRPPEGPFILNYSFILTLLLLQSPEMNGIVVGISVTVWRFSGRNSWNGIQ